MVDIEPMLVDNDTTNDAASTASSAPKQSEERLLDAMEMEQWMQTLQRPTARMHVEALVKKLRKEAAALQVVEATASNATSAPMMTTTTTTTSAGPDGTASPTSVTSPPTTIPMPISTTPSTNSNSSSLVMYQTIDRFSFDAGGYSDKFVTLYIPLPGVGSHPQKSDITCHFDKDALDLIVPAFLDKPAYRLKKDHLQHDIVPEQSKFIVKADKIIIKLAKVKGEYGSYDYWSKLTDPKKLRKGGGGSDKKNKLQDNRSASITELMREMYEDGDDNMRKIIGETMMKQQRGELGTPGIPGMGDDD